MKQNLIYSFVFFLMLIVYFVTGVLIQLTFGDAKLEDVKIALTMTLVVSLFMSLLFFAVLKFIRGRFLAKAESQDYKPTSRLYQLATVLVVISLSLGIYKTYPDAAKAGQAAAAEKQRIVAFKERQRLAAEAEQQRLAAMTPEQREAEAKIKDEQKKAAAQAAAAEVAKRNAEVAKIKDEKDARDRQLQIAAAGAKALKDSMKDPESFVLNSLVVKLDGAACYNYRAKNSFGASLPGKAVRTSAGKFHVKEQDSSFASAWNKECTVDGGTDITAVVKNLGII